MNDANVWTRVVESMMSSQGILRAEDSQRLYDIVNEVEQDPRVDLGTAMSRHPAFQLSISYFRNYVASLRREVSAELAKRFAVMYNDTKASTGKRPTEAQVKSILRHDPDYLNVAAREDKLKYFEEQLDDLHSAFVIRARMLEQLSNNERAIQRQEGKDDFE